MAGAVRRIDAVRRARHRAAGRSHRRQTTAPQGDADQASNQNPGTLSADAAATRSAAISGTPQAASTGDVVVTGTRISRPNLASAAPITSVTRQDIQAQAAVNVEDVLNRLPQVAPDSQQTYNDSDGRQRIKLRSLGFERTLVLIDGKRLGTQNGQDVGIIPTSLLQRVDVLTGGASSVYGSDAVAGVVNFVLRKDFEGVQIDTNYNFYNHNNKDTIVSPLARAAGFSSPRGLTNDGGRADLTLTAGTKLFDDKLHVSGFVNYRHTDEVPITSRSNAGCYLTQLQLNGPLSCGLTPSSSTSGLITPGAGPNKGAQLVNNPDGSRTFVPFAAGPGNASNYFSGYAYQRPSERVNAGGFVTLDLAKLNSMPRASGSATSRIPTIRRSRAVPSTSTATTPICRARRGPRSDAPLAWTACPSRSPIAWVRTTIVLIPSSTPACA